MKYSSPLLTTHIYVLKFGLISQKFSSHNVRLINVMNGYSSDNPWKNCLILGLNTIFKVKDWLKKELQFCWEVGIMNMLMWLHKTVRYMVRYDGSCNMAAFQVEKRSVFCTKIYFVFFRYMGAHLCELTHWVIPLFRQIIDFTYIFIYSYIIEFRKYQPARD